jgi:hypothetical protein
MLLLTAHKNCRNLETDQWRNREEWLLFYLYRARNKITQLSTPTHAQLQRHRLKLIKNHLKTPTCFGLRPSSGSYNVLAKITIILTTLRCMLSVVMWQHVVLFVSGYTCVRVTATVTAPSCINSTAGNC